MREILFRGKMPVESKWAYGSLISEANVFDKRLVLTHIYDKDCNEILVDPKTVGQYTGLKDKNGKKIFEGDILSGHLDDLFPAEESIYEVVWHDYGWHIRSNGFLDTANNGWLKENFEVIGNIYDNPELLEVEEHE